MAKPLFRKKALERLASPDNINELIQITSVRSWLALSAMGALLLALIAWSVFGKMPHTALGNGILIKSGGIAEITSLGSGVIEEVRVEEGTKVQLGDTIAVIAQPELKLHIKNAEERLNELKLEDANQLQINDLEREIAELKVKLSNSSFILSSYSGHIIELMTKPGQFVELGSPITSIEVSHSEYTALEAIIYITPDEGKKVREGMVVRVAPSTVKIEEFGYMLGEVTHVSEYPATKNGMLRVLGNADLVESFSKSDPPIAVRVTLKEAETISGFTWTSAEGPPIDVKAGTLCEANIVISQQRPISLLLPFFREQLKI